MQLAVTSSLSAPRRAVKALPDGLTSVPLKASNPVLPSDKIVHKPADSNDGANVVRNVVIFDETPAFTVFFSANTRTFPNYPTAHD